MMFDRLDTERMALRGVTLSDVDHLVALDADPMVMRYINGGHPSARAEVEEIVRRSVGHRWVAFERSSAAFLGWFSLRPIDPGGRSRELGYRLRRDAWGRGLATEGARALIVMAFAGTEVDGIRAQTMTVNTASRRVMERCGLRYVRTFHADWGGDPIEGGELGDVEYELLRRDWSDPEPVR